MNDAAPAAEVTHGESRPPETPLLALAGAAHWPERGVRRAFGGVVPFFTAPALEPVEGVDLAIGAREVVGVVGEARAGLATLARLAAGLLPLHAGKRRWRGRDVRALRGAEARRARLKVQIVFNDRSHALDPRLRVMDIIVEAPRAHRMISRGQRVEYAGLQLNRVGIDPMAMRRYPYQFSPGERTRIGIARALAVRPELLICDDILSGLDLTDRAQVLNTLLDIHSSLDLGYLLFARDPRTAVHLAERIVVLERGRVVDAGPTVELLHSPNDAYTRALFAAARLGPGTREPPDRTGIAAPTGRNS